MDLAISLRSAVVLLGRFPALSGIDFSVERGEIVTVRGANGAGKTTLLRLCAGLAALYAGEGEVLGCDLARTAGEARYWRRKVGFLGHETRLYGDLTAKENVEFAHALCNGGNSSADRSTVATAALSRLELPVRLHRERAHRLSAGQQRRIALACVMVRNPELWLLDEPHASLDVSGRECVAGIIAEASATGAAVVVVTHEQDIYESEISLQPNLRTVTLAGGKVLELQP